MFNTAHIVLIAVSLSAGCRLAMAGGAPVESSRNVPAAQSVPVDLSDPKRVAQGKFIFHSTCADHCHGHSPALFVGRKDLDPLYAFDTIRKGGQGATPMPPWGDIFSEEEIWSLVAYLKALGAP